MTNLGNLLGRVMMTAVNLPRPQNDREAAFRKFAETEYSRDREYVYDCLKNNRSIDLR